MKRRCNNPKRPDYYLYGGRGISYEARWEFYENFLADMGECPERVDVLSLDRIDCNSDYSKENCRWATCKVQANNQRPKRSASGLTGVSFMKKNHAWLAYASGLPRQVLYYGSNFFEACCARKSFDAAVKGGI